MTLSLDLSKQRAVVTGAASGIGRACAHQLSKAGAHVTAVDLDVDGAERTARELRDGGGSADSVGIDVTSWADCRRLADHVGPDVDILVNSAATWTLGPFVDAEPEAWQRDLDVTLQGPLLVTRALVLGMIERDGGSIVNIGSDAGRIGEPEQVLYSAAKGGIGAFTKALAREIGPHGIRVNCVSPALTRTPASQDFIDSIPERSLGKMYPLRRIGQPDDIAHLVVFLASGLGSYITGQIISVNGGYTTVG